MCIVDISLLIRRSGKPVEGVSIFENGPSFFLSTNALRKRFGTIHGRRISPSQFLILNAIASAFVMNHLSGAESINIYATSDTVKNRAKPTSIIPYATSISLILKPLFLQVAGEVLPATKDHWRILVLDSRYIIPVIYGDPATRSDGYAYDLVYPDHLAFKLDEHDDSFALVRSLYPGVEQVEIFDPWRLATPLPKMN